MRAGFAVDLSATDPMPQLSSLIDVTGQALVLFGMDGRELSQNPVMRRMLGQEREREALLEHVRGVARAVLARVTNAAPEAQPSEDGTRREVATSQAAYRLRGNLVGRNALGRGPPYWSRSTGSRSRCPRRRASAPATASRSASCRSPP